MHLISTDSNVLFFKANIPLYICIIVSMSIDLSVDI